MLRRLTPLNGDAILSLADAKTQCRVLHDDDDADIVAYRNAAVAHVERVSGVILAPADFEWTGWSFPGELPVRPVTSVAVSYSGADGVPVACAGAQYVGDRLLPAPGEAWPYTYRGVKVAFTAGLTSPNDAPDLLAAVRLMVGHLYANREAVTDRTVNEVPLAVDALIQSHRRVMV